LMDVLVLEEVKIPIRHYMHVSMNIYLFSLNK